MSEFLCRVFGHRRHFSLIWNGDSTHGLVTVNCKRCDRSWAEFKPVVDGLIYFDSPR